MSDNRDRFERLMLVETKTRNKELRRIRQVLCVRTLLEHKYRLMPEEQEELYDFLKNNTDLVIFYKNFVEDDEGD